MTLVLALALGACSSTGGSATLPHCVKAPPGVGPGATATLQVADVGSTVCLGRNATLTVYLEAPAGDAPWSTPVASDRQVLVPTANGALALPLGVTGAAFRAKRQGVTTLSAFRSPCTRATIGACDQAHSWHARVVVH